MLIGLLYRTESLQRSIAGESSQQAAVEASRMHALTVDIIDRTRQLAKGLVPVELESAGLVAAMRHLSGNVRSMFRTSCRLKCDPRVQTEPSVTIHVYRIVQEAITNAVKHGKAKNVLIRLDRYGRQGRVSVQDDGVGVPEPAQRRAGMGLRNMAERAALIGAKLDIIRCPEGGTLVTCLKVPMERPPETPDDC